MKIRFGDADTKSVWIGSVKPVLAAMLASRLVNPPLQWVARHALPTTIARRLPLGLPSVRFQPVAAEPFTLLSPSRDLVARDIYWGGGRPTSVADGRALAVMEALCRASATFVDIGAYAGMFALLAARANATIASIAFEIVPENYQLMVANVIENDLVGRVDCRLMGLASSSGSMRLPRRLGLAVNATSVSLGSLFGQGVTIPVSTLDAVSDGWKGPIAMKIDVEGFELDVLNGGAKLFERERPDLLCEILYGEQDATYREVDAFIARFGYRRFLVTDEGLVARPQIVPDPISRDWLFSARPDIETFFAA